MVSRLPGGHIGYYHFDPEPPRVSGVTTRRTGIGTPGALGRPKAAVIGTGRVEGIPVYGQSKVVTTNYRGTRIGSQFYLTYPEPTSVATIDVGYLLCRDYFGRGYDIIRIEVNDEVVFDAENGAIPKIEFRFYNGLQTTVDPLVRTIVGANAGAHTGDVLLFLPDYPSLSAPTVNVVISNAATDTGGTQPIEWTGEVPTDGTNTFRFAGYDPLDGVIYQILTDGEIGSLAICYLVALDVDTHLERYRVPLSGSDIYVSANPYVACLRGSGYIVVFARYDVFTTGDLPTRVYNAATGAIVAEWIENSDERYVWSASVKFGEKFLLAGTDIDDVGVDLTAFAVIDLTAGSFDVTRNSEIPTVGDTPIVGGRISADSASFFVNDGSTVYEVAFNGEAWATTTAYSAVGPISGVHYDPLTEYLLVLETYPSGTFNVQLVTPDTGAVVENFTVSRLLETMSGPDWTERAFPRPGYALFDHNHQEIWAIDISAKTATMLDDHANAIVFVDQARLSYFIYSGFIWTEYTIPGSLPGQITLESHITDILTYLGPYTIDQIEFSGFDGLSDWGDVIKDDGKNIRTLLRSYQDPLGFVWTDIGSKIYFRKTPTDGSFSADDTLVDTDLVFKKDGSITSVDQSDITRIAKVSLEYISKDDNYQSRTVTADSFSALYEVTRSTREAQYQTSLTLSDTEGERLVNELMWSLQAKDRTHAFSTYAEFVKFIPGDVIIVPSGDISYTVELTKVNIKENLVIEFDARDFQTSLSADVAAVTNNGYSGIVSVSLQSQYIHLDIPLLSYLDDSGGVSLIQYGVVASRGQANWGGGTLYEGKTATALDVDYDQAAHSAFIGICTLAFPDMPNAHAGDFANSLIVRKISGSAPTNATEENVLLGSNMAFVGKDGRWEGVGFTTVVDNGDGSYTISGFAVRGWRGTEVYAGIHQIGDYFVLANRSWVQKVEHPLTDLDLTDYFKAVGFDGSPAAVVAERHTITGAAEKPYPVVNVADEIDGADTVVSFDYRSRLSAWEMFSVVPDCGEDVLAFEIDVMDASSPDTAIHTYPATTNDWRYTAAQKVADWGSPPADANIRIYMMSAAVGRGHVAEATISL